MLCTKFGCMWPSASGEVDFSLLSPLGKELASFAYFHYYRISRNLVRVKFSVIS